MDPKTTEITIAAEGVVTIPTNEYGSLIACRTILDMILTSKSEAGYFDSAVLKAAEVQRKLHMDMLILESPKEPALPEGETDA
jgi:hypothetical protein